MKNSQTEIFASLPFLSDFPASEFFYMKKRRWGRMRKMSASKG